MRRDAIGTAAAALGVVLGLLGDATFKPPISVFGLMLSAFLLWYWSWSDGPRWYHWVLGGVLVAASVLPLGHGKVDGDLIASGMPIVNLVLFTAGVVYVVAGLLDHA